MKMPAPYKSLLKCVLCIIVVMGGCATARASQSQGVDFSAFYGFNGIDLDTGYIGLDDGVVRMQVRAYGGYNGELLSIDMPGQATLQGCTLQIRGSANAGSIATDFGLDYGVKAYFGIPDIGLDKEIDLLPIIGLHSLDLRWTASHTFSPFLLGSSATLVDQIAKQDFLDIDVAAALEIPFLSAGVNVSVDASLEATLTGQSISVSNPGMTIYNENTTIPFCGGQTTFTYNGQVTINPSLGFWPGLYAELGPLSWEYSPTRFPIEIPVSANLPIQFAPQTVSFQTAATPTALNVSATISPNSQVQPYSLVNGSGTVTYNTGANVMAGTVVINTGENVYTAAINNGYFNQNFNAPSASRNIAITASESLYGLSATVQSPINVLGTGSGYYTLASCDVIYNVQKDSSGNYTWQSKDAYRTDDTFVDTLLYFTAVNQALDVKWQYFKPDGTQYGTDQFYHISNQSGGGYVCWSGWYISGYASSFPPGPYTVKVWINTGSGYTLVQTKTFTFEYQFTQNKMCQGVQSNSPYDPINPRNVFYQTDSAAYTWANYSNVAQSLNFKWNFYEPNGSLYSSFTTNCADPQAQGYVKWYWVKAWGWVNIAGASAQNKCGDWQTKVYVQNPANNNWDQIYVDHFQILENPNVGPNISVTANPPAPLEGQLVTLTVTGTDNTYLKKVVLHWNAGGVQTWDNISSGSFYQSVQIGSFAVGNQISFWAEAWDTSGNYSATKNGSLVVAPEAVSVPNTVRGTNILQVSQTGSYQTGGAMSNLGNPVEYQFDWGDGTQSAWGPAIQTKSWGANGYYFIEAIARSQTNPSRVSDWSNGEWVTVDSITPTVVITNNNGIDFSTTNSQIELEGTCIDAEPSAGLASLSINTGGTNEGTSVRNQANWSFTVALVPGPNTLVVSATDQAGNVGTAQIIVTRTLPAAPTADFTGSPTNGAEPLLVTFTDTSTGGISNRFWDFGDNGTTNVTTNNVTHTYTAGTYTVTLIVNGPTGVSTNTKPGYIKVLTPFQQWQIQYFGSATCALCGGDADFDGDGMSNTNEFLSGTDPTNSASVFRITAEEQIGSDIRVSFTSVSGKYYCLERCDWMGGAWTRIADNIPGTDGIRQAIDIGGASRACAFYRVRLNQSPNPSQADSDGDGIPDWWMQLYFGHATGQAADKSRATDDADGDGMSNLQEFLAGTNPTNSASAFRILAVAREGSDLRVTWFTAGGHTNVVQAAPNLGAGYSDISSNVLITGSGGTTTNYLDVGGATNSPARFYRVRLAQ